MKKFVAMLAVLAISGVAGAGLTLSIVGHPDNTIGAGEIVTVQIIADSSALADITLALTSMAAPTVDISTAAVISAGPAGTTGNFGVVNVTGGEGLEAYGMVLMADLVVPAGTAPLLGAGLAVDGIKLSFAQEGVYTISLQNWTEGGSALDQIATINVIPEPMTLGLLGLGGLFLRRRLA